MRRMIRLACLAAAMILGGSARLEAADDEARWREVIRPIEFELPNPLERLEWRTDLRQALAEARRTKRPVFVTFRCLPCKQCADFDKDVLEGGLQLSPILKQFVTVRITDAKAMDLALLPASGFQDFDLSWWGYFLSSEGDLYGIFGGRDHVSDTTRISAPALINSLQRVLKHHYDPKRKAWKLDGPSADLAAAGRSPKDLPGYESWSKKHPAAAAEDCLHCHQVAEVLRQPKIDAKDFEFDRDTAIWPFPENVGIILDRDHGLRVQDVAAESPATAIGILPGDELVGAGERRLFGQADFRGVLHREANPSGKLSIVWTHEGELKFGELALEPGWRTTNLDWRMSISQGNIGTGPGYSWSLKGPRKGIPEGQMSIRPWFGKKPRQSIAYRAGLRPNHVITAVDGESPDLFGRPFLVWFRKRYQPGDWVILSVDDGNGPREVRYRLPEK